jgi:hypothetical protein
VTARTAQRRANHGKTHHAGSDASRAQAAKGRCAGSTSRTGTRTGSSTGCASSASATARSGGTASGARATRGNGAHAVNQINGARHALGERGRGNRNEHGSRKNRKTFHGVISAQECCWLTGTTVTIARKGRFPEKPRKVAASDLCRQTVARLRAISRAGARW